MPPSRVALPRWRDRRPRRRGARLRLGAHLTLLASIGLIVGCATLRVPLPASPFSPALEPAALPTPARDVPLAPALAKPTPRPLASPSALTLATPPSALPASATSAPPAPPRREPGDWRRGPVDDLPLGPRPRLPLVAPGLPPWVATHRASTLWEGPDERARKVVPLPQWTVLRVLAGHANRLYVRYDREGEAVMGWVERRDVGPVGGPPARPTPAPAEVAAPLPAEPGAGPAASISGPAPSPPARVISAPLPLPGPVPSWPAVPTPAAPEQTIPAAPVPAGEEAEAPVPPPTPVPEPFTYEVEEGDTLAGIAARFGVDVETLVENNDLADPDVVPVGTRLVILPVPGLLYHVTAGDTLSAISERFGIDPAEVLRHNRLESADHIVVGQQLVLPGARLARPGEQWAGAEAGGWQKPPETRGTGWLIWPAVGPITTYFMEVGWTSPRGHRGLDIAADYGAPVRAADSGVVVLRDRLVGDWGWYIIVDHGNGMTTLYGHLSAFEVEPGEAVAQGQVIGRVGSTGFSTGPHLHFEVAMGGTLVDPLALLP